MHDRDTKFSRAFVSTLTKNGVSANPLPAPVLATRHQVKLAATPRMKRVHDLECAAFTVAIRCN